jgi:hypothetical protein
MDSAYRSVTELYLLGRAMPASRSSSFNRLLSTSYYLGLAPLTSLFRCRSSNPLLQHHRAQAMSAFFLLFLLFLTACLIDTAETILFVEFPDLAGSLVTRYGWAAVLLDFGSYAALVLAGILWISLLGLAVRGSTWKVPVLKQLSERKWIICFSSIVNSVVLVLIPLVAIFAVHATSLTRRSTDGASVYFLYDEGVGVPRWGFALGLYRILVQARRNWGNGSTVLDCLNRQTLNTALTNAKVLIIATHGGDGYATTWYAPEVLRIEPPETGASDESKSPRYLRARVLGRDGQWSTPDSAQ